MRPEPCEHRFLSYAQRPNRKSLHKDPWRSSTTQELQRIRKVRHRFAVRTLRYPNRSTWIADRRPRVVNPGPRAQVAQTTRHLQVSPEFGSECRLFQKTSARRAHIYKDAVPPEAIDT